MKNNIVFKNEDKFQQHHTTVYQVGKTLLKAQETYTYWFLAKSFQKIRVELEGNINQALLKVLIYADATGLSKTTSSPSRVFALRSIIKALRKPSTS